ncbi:MAG: ABC transporter permease, partial [Streptococcaceae bacterium]|nr:ABC transporter permease [Streptococcaceae bacterium]
TEDVPKASQPMAMLGLAGYLLTISFQTQPDHVVMQVASFIPFISTFVLPLRIATQVATMPQILISMGIMVVSLLFMLKFSARIYKSNVLIYGDDGMLSSFKQSIRNVRQDYAKSRRG